MSQIEVKPIQGQGLQIVFELAIISGGFLILSLMFKPHWVTNFMIFCILVMSYDLLYGFTGQLSFGHMLYFGTGAYGTAITIVHLTKDPMYALLITLLFTFFVSAVVGLIVIQTKGASFALLNMAFNEVGFFLVASVFVKYTRGADGISLTADPLWGLINFYKDTHAFIFVLVSLVIVFLFLRIVTQAPFGILVRCVKENEIRTQFLGYNTQFYKWITFVMSSTIAGFAGSIFALTQGFVSPGTIGPFGNVDIIFAVLIGGAGNLFGALAGGVILMTIKNLLPSFIPVLEKYVGFKLPQWEMWLGIVLLIIVFAWRQGTVGFVQLLLSKFRFLGKVRTT